MHGRAVTNEKAELMRMLEATVRLDQKRALTVKDVANLYSVTPARVYVWIKTGHLRPVRLPGNGPYRFRRSDLDEFDKQCLVESSNDPTTGSEGEETAGTSTGPTNNLVGLDPFQRGRRLGRPPKNGGTNG